jgi:hypothetical protein
MQLLYVTVCHRHEGCDRITNFEVEVRDVPVVACFCESWYLAVRKTPILSTLPKKKYYLKPEELRK